MDSLVILRNTIHYSLHFIIPVILAFIFYKKQWKRVGLILITTMLVDLDHLFAVPIFDPHRCSIGFHYLHSYTAIIIYVLLLFIPKVRIVALGLLLHMLTDYQDCFWS